jgi:hypothetical protein
LYADAAAMAPRSKAARMAMRPVTIMIMTMITAITNTIITIMRTTTIIPMIMMDITMQLHRRRSMPMRQASPQRA